MAVGSGFGVEFNISEVRFLRYLWIFRQDNGLVHIGVGLAGRPGMMYWMVQRFCIIIIPIRETAFIIIIVVVLFLL